MLDSSEDNEHGDTGSFPQKTHEQDEETLDIFVEIPEVSAHFVPEDEKAFMLAEDTVDPGDPLFSLADLQSIEYETPALEPTTNLAPVRSRDLFYPENIPIDADQLSAFKRHRKKLLNEIVSLKDNVDDTARDAAIAASLAGTSDTDSSSPTSPESPEFSGDVEDIEEERTRNRQLLSFGSGGNSRKSEGTKERNRKALKEILRRDFREPSNTVPVFSRRGGVGKTVISLLLGMALASEREKAVLIVDANSDQGNLIDRVVRQNRASIFDVYRNSETIIDSESFEQFVSQDESLMSVLATHPDPEVVALIDQDQFAIVLETGAKFFELTITDLGTNVFHPFFAASFAHAQSLVFVSGGGLDEARLALDTLNWLAAKGYEELVSRSVVAINLATLGTDETRIDDVEALFRTRVRSTVQIPFDPYLAGGAKVTFGQLHHSTQQAARLLAASLVEGLSEEIIDQHEGAFE